MSAKNIPTDLMDEVVAGRPLLIDFDSAQIASEFKHRSGRIFVESSDAVG